MGHDKHTFNLKKKKISLDKFINLACIFDVIFVTLKRRFVGCCQKSFLLFLSIMFSIEIIVGCYLLLFPFQRNHRITFGSNYFPGLLSLTWTLNWIIVSQRFPHTYWNYHKCGKCDNSQTNLVNNKRSQAKENSGASNQTNLIKSKPAYQEQRSILTGVKLRKGIPTSC